MQARTIKNIEETVKLYNEGLNNAEIAKIIQKPPSCVTYYMKLAGLENRIAKTWTTKNILKDEELQHKINELIKENKTQKEICKELGIGIETIQKYYKANNIIKLGTAKYRTRTGLENFLLRLQENNSKYEYISGYVNDNSKVKLRCKNCGEIIERWASNVRSGKEFRCFNCERKRKEQKQAYKEQKMFEKKRIYEANRQLDSIQLSFSICKNCGALFLKQDRGCFCSDECWRKYTNNVKWKKHEKDRINKAKQNGRVDYTITLDKLIKRDNNICYICNRECNLNDYTFINNTKVAGNYYPSIDHVVPIAKGGTHSWDNVKLAHRICNSRKGSKTF